MWEVAYAQAETAAKQPSMLESLFPILFIFLVFYFLIIRPQSKQRKLHAEMIQNLKVGDEVITAGGIFGKIKGLTDKFVTLEVDDGVSLKILRSQVLSQAKQEIK
jgi:preprotein translocase subunit YajC